MAQVLSFYLNTKSVTKFVIQPHLLHMTQVSLTSKAHQLTGLKTK